ncbi:MAG: hypothetical protein R2695_20230 [Acidimicrobiales bacterium]
MVLFGLAQLGDPDGYLSTDVGGKTATIQVIVDHGVKAPDLGYWAEADDPDGSLYPMWSTARIGDAWVNVTTLPMLYLAAPLWKLGGARLALLVPVLGTVFAALAAAGLTRRLGGDPGRQATAFWVVGLASPATIYALDLWEHSLGLALIAWGVVGVVDACDRGRVRPWVPPVAGLAFGIGPRCVRRRWCTASWRASCSSWAMWGGRWVTAAVRGAGLALGAVGGRAQHGLQYLIYDTTLRVGRSGGTTGPRQGKPLAVRDAGGDHRAVPDRGGDAADDDGGRRAARSARPARPAPTVPGRSSVASGSVSRRSDCWWRWTSWSTGCVSSPGSQPRPRWPCWARCVGGRISLGASSP